VSFELLGAGLPHFLPFGPITRKVSVVSNLHYSSLDCKPWRRGPWSPPSPAQVDRLLWAWDVAEDEETWMTRAEARNLRRALFGPVGLRTQPGPKGGDMWLTLSDGRELLFDYEPRRLGLRRAGYVRVILCGAPPLTGPQLSASVVTVQ
jgi:hypothetical protein